MPETIDDTDSIPKYAPLTAKQRQFLDSVIESDYSHGSLVAAYKSAYDWQGSDKAASVEASRLIRNPKITLAMRERVQRDGVSTDSVIAGVKRIAESRDDQAALNAYITLGRYLGLWDSTAPVPTYQQTNTTVSVTSGALSDILQMLSSPSESTSVIESASSGASRLSNSG